MDSYSFLVISILTLIIIILVYSLIITIKRFKRPAPLSSPARLDAIVALAAAKHKEASLASSLLHEVVESMDMGIILVKNGAIDSFNPTAKRLLPELKGLIGSDLSYLRFKPGDKNIKLDKKVVQTAFMDLTSPMGLVTIQDVTESFDMASKLKVKERFSLMGRLSGQMAHQLKTELSVIAGRAQLLSLKLVDENSREARLIYQEARSISQKISHLLSFYKYQELQLCEIDLLSFLNHLVSNLKKNKEDFIFEINCPDELIINTDPYLLESALFLIMQNSMEEEMEASMSRVDTIQINSSVRVTICDNGKGIQDNMIEQIFDPFVTTRENGLGLGLFMARELIDKLKGRLYLDENPEKGACFNIELPMEIEDEKNTDS